MDWNLLWMALGLALVLEGSAYFLFPERMLDMLRQFEATGPGALRWMGLAAMLVGVLLLWIGRWIG